MSTRSASTWMACQMTPGQEEELHDAVFMMSSPQLWLLAVLVSSLTTRRQSG